MLTSLRSFAERRLQEGSLLWKLLSFVNDIFRSVYEPIRFWICWKAKGPALSDLSNFEKSVYSQNGEDGVIEAIFRQIGVAGKYAVEIGAGHGTECNSSYLRERGWTVLGLDADPDESEWVKKEFLTKENIARIFRKYRVPKEFDLLSIDVDGNDYWLWKAIRTYKPRVVIIEYNANIPPSESKTIEYKSDFVWDKIHGRGASLRAMAKLGRKKGYTLVGVESQTVNAFFIRDDLIAGNFKVRSFEQIWRYPRRGDYYPREILDKMVEV